MPVTSDMELSVMKNKIAELKAQLNRDAPRERSASSSGEKEQGFTFVSYLFVLNVYNKVGMAWIVTYIGHYKQQ